MNQTIVNEMVEQTHELMKTPTCCSELKEEAQTWLDAIGTPKEEEATKHYFDALLRDIMPLDQLIQFSQSQQGKNYFGETLANQIHTHAKEIKEQGAMYCDCPACLVVASILAKKEAVFAE